MEGRTKQDSPDTDILVTKRGSNDGTFMKKREFRRFDYSVYLEDSLPAFFKQKRAFPHKIEVQKKEEGNYGSLPQKYSK